MDLDALRARVGTTLRGKWVLERLLGHGGMAAVYLARHRIGRLEAVKILHTHLLDNKELLVRFEREARIANRLHHPGAVQITDVDVTEDGVPFLVMELAEGVTLGDLCRAKRVPPLQLLGLIDQLLDVLATAHPLGIIHRDIKPANLVLQSDGRLRVLDFGVAKIEGSTFTEQGATVGTAYYMPPEQVRGEAIDARSDLFAVGATMFRVLTGRQVHSGPSPGEVLFQAATIPAPKLLEIAPDVPTAIARIVDRALQFEADHRYPDARAMQADVRAVLELLSQPPPQTTLTMKIPLHDPVAHKATSRDDPDGSEDPTSVTPFSRPFSPELSDDVMTSDLRPRPPSRK